MVGPKWVGVVPSVSLGEARFMVLIYQLEAVASGYLETPNGLRF
jgi:hypothetical protein